MLNIDKKKNIYIYILKHEIIFLLIIFFHINKKNKYLKVK